MKSNLTIEQHFDKIILCLNSSTTPEHLNCIESMLNTFIRRWKINKAYKSYVSRIGNVVHWIYLRKQSTIFIKYEEYKWKI
jgi:hypothetical protein